MMWFIRMFKQVVDIYNKLYNLLLFYFKEIKAGSNLRINGRVFFFGTSNVVFGNDVKINSGRRYNPIGGDTSTTFVTYGNGKITIGNNCGISNSTIVSSSSVIIEDDVLLGGSVKIYDTDFHSIDYIDRIIKKDSNIKSKPVHIRKGVFIGAGSMILKGVDIGECSVIAAGSIVTKNIPPFQLWGGYQPDIYVV